MSSWKNLWAVKLINRPDNWTSSWHSLSSFPVGKPFVSLFLTIHRKKCIARRLSSRNEAIAKTKESTILSYFSWIAQKCVESSSFPFSFITATKERFRWMGWMKQGESMYILPQPVAPVTMVNCCSAYNHNGWPWLRLQGCKTHFTDLQRGVTPFLVAICVNSSRITARARIRPAKWP